MTDTPKVGPTTPEPAASGSIEAGEPRFFAPKRLSVRNVRVFALDSEGRPCVTRTKDSVLQPLLRPILAANTPSDLETAVAEGLQRMHSTGVYESVGLQDAVVVDPSAPESQVDVSLLVKERNFNSTIGGDIGRAPDNRPEARAKFTFSLLNQLGHAETVEASMHRNQLGSDVYTAGLTLPTLFGTMRSLKLEAFSDQVNFMSRSAFLQQDRGVRATLGSWGSPCTLAYVAQWRDLLPSLSAAGSLDSTASRSILADMTPSIKSALVWNYNSDKRKCYGGPISGPWTSASLELAGLGGDVRHVRATADGQLNYSFWRTLSEREATAGRSPTGKGWLADWLSPGVTLSFAGSLGAILPLAGSKTSVIDRFFLGGTHSMRGFAHAGIGPRAARVAPAASSGEDQAGAGSEHGDALGGDVMWSATTRVLLPPPLPWRMLLNIGARSHLFASVGQVAASSSPASSMFKDVRSVVGVGFTLPIPLPGSGAACLEVNYPILRNAAPQDVVVGVDFGVSF